MRLRAEKIYGGLEEASFVGDQEGGCTRGKEPRTVAHTAGTAEQRRQPRGEFLIQLFVPRQHRLQFTANTSQSALRPDRRIRQSWLPASRTTEAR